MIVNRENMLYEAVFCRFEVLHTVVEYRIVNLSRSQLLLAVPEEGLFVPMGWFADKTGCEPSGSQDPRHSPCSSVENKVLTAVVSDRLWYCYEPLTS